MFEGIWHIAIKNKKVVQVSAMALLAFVYVALCAVNVAYALTLIIVSVLLYLLHKYIDAGFMVYLGIMPFSYASLFGRLPFGVSAVWLMLLFSAVLVVYFILFKKPYKTKAVFPASFAVLLILYGIAWVRSLNYALTAFSDYVGGKLSLPVYFLDYTSWTFIAFLPLILIVYYYRDKVGIEKIIRTVAISSIMLFGYLFFIYFFQIDDKSDFEVIRTQLANFSGHHGNGIATYCILSFPLILAWFFNKKSKFAFFTLLMTVAGTAICFSRTAYFIILFEFFLFMLLSGRGKWIPLSAIIIGIVILLLLPDMFIDRAITGLDTGNYDEITAGRTNLIWGPILQELKHKPLTILFGSGTYGFTNTDAWKYGRVPAVDHAHNMYLDCVLDMGILGLTVFLSFFITIIIWFGRIAARYIKISPNYANLLYGCMISVICYMISGLTGRSFFPAISNSYLWIVTGLGIAIAGYVKTDNLKEQKIQPSLRSGGHVK